MRVSTRLVLTGMLLLGAVVALAAVLVLNSRALKHELTKNQTASEVLSAVSGIRYLTLEYLTAREARPEQQWKLRHASLTALLSNDSDIDADILGTLRQSNQTISRLFTELLQRNKQAGSAAQSDVAAERDTRLTAQIVVRLERMVADALILSERSREGVLRAQRRASEAVLIVGAVIVLLVAASTYVTLRAVSRPLARLREGAVIVGGGNLDFELAIDTKDELGDLARAFNDMTRKLRERDAQLGQTQADLARATRVATLGEMTASIAHEINQPLCAIVNNAGASLRWLAAHELTEVRISAEQVIEDSLRASEIIERIRAMTKKAPARQEWSDLNGTLTAALTLTRGELTKHQIELRTELDHNLPQLCIDKVQIQQVVLNLIVNAVEAMRDQTELRVLTVSSQLLGPDAACVSVQDTGCGLGEAQLGHLFDAFYTTKTDGMGMGLAVSRSIIEAHRGSLSVLPNESRGLTFQFTLPLHNESA